MVDGHKMEVEPTVDDLVEDSRAFLTIELSMDLEASLGTLMGLPKVLLRAFGADSSPLKTWEKSFRYFLRALLYIFDGVVVMGRAMSP